jgi:hypothetical protein
MFFGVEMKFGLSFLGRYVFARYLYNYLKYGVKYIRYSTGEKNRARARIRYFALGGGRVRSPIVPATQGIIDRSLSIFVLFPCITLCHFPPYICTQAGYFEHYKRILDVL